MTPTDLKDTHNAEMQDSEAPELIWFTKVGEDIVPNSRRLTDEDTEYLRADLAPDRATFEQMREALKRIQNWRTECHDYDRAMGHEPREFDDEDWTIVEAYARAVLKAAEGK